jgi:signal transduction histidine kinase
MLGRLDASIEAQRRFTSDASHELRSPLTALRGELEVARRRDRSGEEYRRVLDSALEEVDRLARLVDDLLMLARADAGAAPARPRDARLATVAARVVERLAPSAHERGVELALDAGSDTTGRFDPDLMERLLWNLVENALRYTPRGGRVAVGAYARGEELELVVDDTGPGIPADMRTLVFDRFYRADDSRTQGPESGTGLGLSMVRSIARAHAGEATVEEAPGGGARFRVRFRRTMA